MSIRCNDAPRAASKYKFSLTPCAFILPLVLATGGARVAHAADGNASAEGAGSDDYVFDANLFRGNAALSQTALSNLNRAKAVAPATYKVDLFVNNQFVEHLQVPFVAMANGNVAPCLSRARLEAAGVAPGAIAAPAEAAQDGQQVDCVFVEQSIKGGSSRFDLPHLRLDLSIPQALMKNVPRGYVAPSELDRGSTVGFLNYMGNFHHAVQRGGGMDTQNSAYVSLNGGLNVGAWRLRQQSNLTYQRKSGVSWTNTRTYAQRSLPSIGSAVTVGQNFTSGRFLSGLGYTGVQLATDQRMLPDSQRGYAPVVRGVARTNARVSVRQGGNEIYQTTVAPGPFEINDLYPTSFSGDLEVVVDEADGTVNRFTVPFSAVPESMRPGQSRYDFVVGKTRQIGKPAAFSDFTYQRGLTNTVTVNAGARVANGYQAVVFGGTYSSPFGAFGLDATYSRARLPKAGYQDGWMAHLSYSRTYQATNTTVALAGYRYSTAGYRDLADVLGVRSAARHGQAWTSSTYRQRSRMEAVVSQPLGASSSLYLSGSIQDYRGGRDRDTQVQLGYSTLLRHSISLSFSVARMYADNRYGTHGSYGSPFDGYAPPGARPGQRPARAVDTTAMLSLSIPLGSTSRATPPPVLNAAYSHSSSGSATYQAAVSGNAGAEQTLSYSVGATHDTGTHTSAWNGSLQKRFSNTAVGVSASRGSHYWQASANAQGALVVHGGGVTLGPYAGDTFALVEAKGAEGAQVLNGLGTRIDRHGYAVVPVLTPYRYNVVALNPTGIKSTTELLENEKRVAPDAGAIVKVTFHTRKGQAMLIRTRLASGQAIPVGAEVYNEAGEIVGLVGQGGQVYARSEKPRGLLELRWGEDTDQRCTLSYDLTGENPDRPLVTLHETCGTQALLHTSNDSHALPGTWSSGSTAGRPATNGQRDERRGTPQ